MVFYKLCLKPKCFLFYIYFNLQTKLFARPLWLIYMDGGGRVTRILCNPLGTSKLYTMRGFIYYFFYFEGGKMRSFKV